MIKRFVNTFLVLLFGAGGFFLSLRLFDQEVVLPSHIPHLTLGLIGLITLLGIAAGIVLAPWLIQLVLRAVSLLEQMLIKTPVQDLVVGSLGLILGLIIANLLGLVFLQLSIIGKIIWVFLTLFLGYLGLTIGIKKRGEITLALRGVQRHLSDREKSAPGSKETAEIQKILDTSVIIDGRIVDLCASGFIEGTLVVPDFVLEELRHIADSSDLLKRNRGRRGLDILNELRRGSSARVVIHDKNRDLDDASDVDTKLVKLAQKIGAKIFTNDFNLNKVAELHGVRVLNINELANAVKPVVLPGEEMVVQVVKDGKEHGQGVAYLDDGTMIVVDGGRKYMQQTITVVVTSVLQTSAGRMIFARPQNEREGGQTDYKRSQVVHSVE